METDAGTQRRKAVLRSQVVFTQQPCARQCTCEARPPRLRPARLLRTRPAQRVTALVRPVSVDLASLSTWRAAEPCRSCARRGGPARDGGLTPAPRRPRAAQPLPPRALTQAPPPPEPQHLRRRPRRRASCSTWQTSRDAPRLHCKARCVRTTLHSNRAQIADAPVMPLALTASRPASRLLRSLLRLRLRRRSPRSRLRLRRRSRLRLRRRSRSPPRSLLRLRRRSRLRLRSR